MDQKPKTTTEVRRTDINPKAGLLIPPPYGGGTDCVAPAALKDAYFGLATASRPWLLNDGPSDLALTPVTPLNQPKSVKYVITVKRVSLNDLFFLPVTSLKRGANETATIETASTPA